MLAALILFAAIRVEVVETEAVPAPLADQLVAWVSEAAAAIERDEGRIEVRVIGGATRVLLILEGGQGREEIAEPSASAEWQPQILAAVARLFPKPVLIPPAPPPPAKPPPWFEITLAAGGAAASAAAIGFALKADGAQSDLGMRTFVDQDFRDGEDAIARDRVLAAILLSSGVALIVTSVGLLLF